MFMNEVIKWLTNAFFLNTFFLIRLLDSVVIMVLFNVEMFVQKQCKVFVLYWLHMFLTSDLLLLH